MLTIIPTEQRDYTEPFLGECEGCSKTSIVTLTRVGEDDALNICYPGFGCNLDAWAQRSVARDKRVHADLHRMDDEYCAWCLAEYAVLQSHAAAHRARVARDEAEMAEHAAAHLARVAAAVS